MRQQLSEIHDLDAEGRPAGGVTIATGLNITWQQGPLVHPQTGERMEPNGCFVETVLAAAKGRLEFYNEGQFRCRENSLAITKIEEALHWLQSRTADREARGVEGTHQV